MSYAVTPATQFARCHHLTQQRQCDSQKKHATPHVLSAALATQHDDGGLQTAPAMKNATHLRRNMRMSHGTIDALWNMLWNVTKCPSATRNRGKPYFKTSENDGFCNFLHRHGDATTKPKNPNKTCRSLKTSISYEIHEPQNICYLKTIQNRCFVRCFRQFSKHQMPPCHGICTLSPLTQHRQCDSQKTRNTTRPKCCACHATWPATKNATHLPKTTQQFAHVTRNDFWHSMKHVVECHKVPRLPHETTLRDVWTF